MHRFAFALLVSLGVALTACAQSIFTSELLTNAGAELGNLTGWTDRGSVHYIADNGAYEAPSSYLPHTGSYQFVAGANAGASGILAQTVSLTNTGVSTSLIDSGGVAARVSFWEQSYNQGLTSSDYAQVRITFYDGSNQTLGTSYTSSLMSVDLWSNYQGDFTLPSGTRSVEYAILSFRANNGGSYIDAFVDDNSMILVSAIPEPSTYALAAAACALSFALWRRRAARSGANTLEARASPG